MFNSINTYPGLNHISYTTELNKYWYVYTMQSDGKLVINSDNGNYVVAHHGSCESLTQNVWGYGNLTIPSLSAGDEVFIEWSVSTGYDLYWFLSEQPSEPGDDCSNAVEASAGSNTIPSTSNSHYWYRYTITEGQKLKISSSNGKAVSIYEGNCEELEFKGSKFESITLIDLAVGSDIYIEWRTNGVGNYSWNIEEVPYDTGDACVLPMEATAGINTIAETPLDFIWYTYTVQDDGYLTIEHLDNSYSRL